MGNKKINLGVIGFGGFAMFAVQNFLQLPEIKIAGMCCTHREAAQRASERFGLAGILEITDMLANPEIDLVYIATPPFLHYEHSMKALNAGKNVIVEKPFALSLEQADEMIALAKEKNLLLSVNLMQRYNLLYDKVKQLINSKALGEVLHGYFENYASDEGLSPKHWFWDKGKSGGIFIEHGVHFFDMFEGWLGKGKVECAQESMREGTNIIDQVQCSVKYKNDVMINYYHGFTQANRMDRQELRILFEKGDITLYEWVPTRIKIHAITNETETKIINDLFPYARIDMTSWYNGDERKTKSRFKDYETYQQYDLYWNEQKEKMHIYGDILRAMIEDQIEWIKNKSHKRIITEENGRSSLEMAVEAERLSEKK
ncbi:MAG TPA: Gfo/Idh/MocA family oxidoreductase [Ignavibacteria bacterium]|nr:Gfo/Idh/MocA family oxidoreductase [Ignavibacteria bacterium]